MTLLPFLGYFAAIFIGLTMGLMGGGGSILTVPVLVYLIGLNPLLATAYSLLIVGATALVGAAGYFRKGLVAHRTALLFALPSLVAVFATRKLLLPAIPAQGFMLGSFPVSKGLLVMTVFAVLMVAAATAMIRSTQRDAPPDEPEAADVPTAPNQLLMTGIGLAVGVLTGFVGAGGGFLIIPALVLVGRLPMKRAVGTSLLIIAINSLVGFTGDLTAGLRPDWGFLLVFLGFALVGIGLGTRLSRFIPGARLKPAFGWFTLVMGSMVLLKEFWPQ